MSADCCFSTLLSAAQRGWFACDGDEALLSLALPIDGIDPLLALPQLAEQESLQVLWDSAPGLCLAAAGPCQELELAGSRRFEHPAGLLLPGGAPHPQAGQRDLNQERPKK